jgi:hypothetical protein
LIIAHSVAIIDYIVPLFNILANIHLYPVDAWVVGYQKNMVLWLIAGLQKVALDTKYCDGDSQYQDVETLFMRQAY